MVYESSLDDFYMINYYVLGIKHFVILRVGLHPWEKNAFLVSAQLQVVPLHLSCRIDVKTWELPTFLLKSFLLPKPRITTVSSIWHTAR